MKGLLSLLDMKMFRMPLTSWMILSLTEEGLKLLMIVGRARRDPEAALDPDPRREADPELVQRHVTASRERNQEAAANLDLRVVTSLAQDPRTRETGRVVQNQEARAVLTATIGT